MLIISGEAKREVIKSFIITSLLALLLLIYVWGEATISGFLSSIPFFIFLYFFFFSIGDPIISDWFQNKLNGELKKNIIFPTLLIVVYYSYLLLNGADPFKGTNFLFPFLVYFPVLMFTAKRDNLGSIDWVDFFTFTLFLLPITLVKFEPNTSMPFGGNGFDSVYRVAIILTAVYSFSVVRGVRDVGFYPIFKWKYLGYALLSWTAFYSFAIVIGYLTNFMKIVGHDSITFELLSKIFWGLLTVFLHTALFEELFFRGLLQNLFSKRIKQSNDWKIFWKWGLGILILFSLLTGYTLEGGLKWLPALVTISLFVAAFVIEGREKSEVGAFTALAITSVIFGLVHYHAGSIVFISLASIAGWAYGYTYYKTKNVFYSALVHTLVNNTALIIGIELMK
ncbi:hypothetical protein MNBD_IGNAVI01-782 [hydrothermal vent metagenome]|uniref:CAAX prenyl protease 2/Lysostaphin resistance protein A-like domain-containing protein n=1 Tax=hydrothermal vent metagenome TaxID=652676 RepID=A0A3B1BVD6_9ZZZZ